MDSTWATSWGAHWAESWGLLPQEAEDAVEAPQPISAAFAADHSGLHLLPHEIAQRRRLWLKLQRDKAEAAKQKRRNDELALLAMYAMVRKAA